MPVPFALFATLTVNTGIGSPDHRKNADALETATSNFAIPAPTLAQKTGLDTRTIPVPGTIRSIRSLRIEKTGARRGRQTKSRGGRSSARRV